MVTRDNRILGVMEYFKKNNWRSIGEFYYDVINNIIQALEKDEPFWSQNRTNEATDFLEKKSEIDVF